MLSESKAAAKKVWFKLKPAESERAELLLHRGNSGNTRPGIELLRRNSK